MTKNISRLLTQTKKHYSAARIEQGRVLLDSDLNEGAKLGEEDRRRLLVDALGPKGSPDQGFLMCQSVMGTKPGQPLQDGDYLFLRLIGFNDSSPSVYVLPVALYPGSMYLGGLRFDIEDIEELVFQRDFLQIGVVDAPVVTKGSSFRHLYYLEAWEQDVTSVEDIELHEAMLRGPDTSTRVRRMRRARVFDASAVEPPICTEAWAALIKDRESLENVLFDPRTHGLRSKGRLQLVFTGGEAEDPCSPVDPFGKRYLGAENQTLRIMLTSSYTYVWALDNASPLFQVKVTGLTSTGSTEPVTVTLLNPPTDEQSWPFQNRVVEILPFAAILDGGNVDQAGPHFRKIAAEIGVFTRAITTYDPTTRSFQIEDATQVLDLVHSWSGDHPDAALLAEPPDANGARFFYMRLWHEAPTTDDIEISTTSPNGLADTGLMPVFLADGCAGDFWVATLRTDAPGQVQPFDLLDSSGVSPHGPHRYIAPLALVEGTVNTDEHHPAASITLVRDCRPRLRRLTERCPTLTVGDGRHSFGDFLTIAEALQALPTTGGIIAVRPGVYAPPVSIVNRTNVTIEGCGDATVIESQFSDGLGVFYVESSRDIHISSFLIHAGDEPGVVVKGSTDVTLDSLHIISGVLDDDGFQEGGASDFAQVQVIPSDPTGDSTEGTASSHVGLNRLTLKPNRQTGLKVWQVQDISIAELDAQGMTGDDDGLQDSPLVFLYASDQVAMRESNLVGVGQVPLRASNLSNCQLSYLSVSSQVRSTPHPFGTNLYPAVHIESSANLGLRRSTLSLDNAPSEHAVLVMGGDDLVIENNSIIADGASSADAWGGLQVRGRSSSVRIVGNRISGGYGHGITLGSVRWASDTAENRFGIEGAGKGQTEGSSGSFSATGVIDHFTELSNVFVPDDEGLVTDVAITDNAITGMGTNGISPLSVVGLLGQFVLPTVKGLTIDRNTITYNVLRPSLDIPDVGALPFSTSTQGNTLGLSMLPLGGIVLATAERVDIRDNIIVSNGTASTVTIPDQGSVAVPINGVFVLTGDSLCIENNRIENNGATITDEAVVVRSGVRAGIAVMLAGAGSMGSEADIDSLLSTAHPTLEVSGVALRVRGNTVSHPEGRALHAVGMGSFQIERNFFSSLGNRGSDDTTEQFAIGELIYIQNLGGPFERFGAEKLDQAESPYKFPWITFDVLLDQKTTTSPRRFEGAGGQIQFNNNQTVFDWQNPPAPTQSAPLSYFPIVLLSQDHIGMLGNHLALRIESTDELPTSRFPRPFPEGVDDDNGFAFEPVLSHVMVAGVTVSVQLNRISENVRASYLSLMANADLLNYTAYNQTTHDTLVTETNEPEEMVAAATNVSYVIDSPQQVIYHVTPGVNDVWELLRTFMREFIQLTFAIDR